jgi:hypothetical protein
MTPENSQKILIVTRSVELFSAKQPSPSVNPCSLEKINVEERRVFFRDVLQKSENAILGVFVAENVEYETIT